MAATAEAMYQQNGAASVQAAFTQNSPAQNLDLIQIRGIGGATLARVDYTGAVSFGDKTFVLTAVAVASLAITAVASTGGSSTYTGTFTGATSAWVGKTAVIAGMGNSGNNGSFVITSANTTTLVVTNAAPGANETHAGTVSVTGVSVVTYSGTITGGSSAYVGRNVTVTGFTTSGNNVVAQPITSANGTTFTIAFTGTQAAETHAASATMTSGATKGTRVGRFQTFLAAGSTLAQLFANAFSNPSNQDILQVMNQGGNISYYLDYQGVAHGS